MKHRTHDPASPLVLNIASLARSPGSRIIERREVSAPSDFGTEVIGVPEGSAMDLEVTAQSVSEGVLVTVRVHAPTLGECVRCLEPVHDEVDVRFDELFYYPDRAAAMAEATEEDDPEHVHVLDGDLIDLEPLLRDAVIPALPYLPLCTVDCPGLCATCGARLADTGPEHTHEILDPRWSSLGALIDDEQRK